MCLVCACVRARAVCFIVRTRPQTPLDTRNRISWQQAMSQVQSCLPLLQLEATQGVFGLQIARRPQCSSQPSMLCRRTDWSADCLVCPSSRAPPSSPGTLLHRSLFSCSFNSTSLVRSGSITEISEAVRRCLMPRSGVRQRCPTVALPVIVDRTTSRTAMLWLPATTRITSKAGSTGARASRSFRLVYPRFSGAGHGVHEGGLRSVHRCLALSRVADERSR